MYVCNCNGFTERDVRSLVEDGTQSAAQVYRALGGEPRCGKCVREVCQMIRDGRTAALTAVEA